MNSTSGLVPFSAALAINLFTVGTILAGGLFLSLKFIASFSPRIRYFIALAVFMLAIAIPLVVTFEVDLRDHLFGSMSSRSSSTGMIAGVRQANAQTGYAAIPPVSSEPWSASLSNQITSFVAESPFRRAILLVWLLGFVLLLLRHAHGLNQLRRERKGWRRLSDSERADLLTTGGAVVFSAENKGPATVGMIFPVIVLPSNLSDSLSLDEKRLIARHELDHAIWRDPLIGLFVGLMRACFWFSPGLWLIDRLIRAEREAAADLAALASIENDLEPRAKALIYADTLMAVASQFKVPEGHNRSCRAIGIGGDARAMENRIRRLLSPVRITFRSIAATALSLVFTLVGISVIPLAGGFSRLMHSYSTAAFAANRAELELGARPIRPGSAVEPLRTPLPSSTTEFNRNRQPPAVKRGPELDTLLAITPEPAKTEQILTPLTDDLQARRSRLPRLDTGLPPLTPKNAPIARRSPIKPDQ